MEAAIVIPVFLTLVLGAIDLGVGVLRFNALSQAARQGARQAIVHGELAQGGWNGGSWGPNTIDCSLATPAGVDAYRAVAAASPVLVNCPPSQTRVRVEWLDGGNTVGDRVRFTVTSDYQPMVTFVLGAPAIPLSASSTMPIAH
ncbi:MAG TPA: TadE/TadG family type IV pilus assembly protein [Fimbriiglobus sp.]|nr:TadE/TadG family type IV pilus assembly protein [Fimbriiglobus sp.]